MDVLSFGRLLSAPSSARVALSQVAAVGKRGDLSDRIGRRPAVPHGRHLAPFADPVLGDVSSQPIGWRARFAATSPSTRRSRMTPALRSSRFVLTTQKAPILRSGPLSIWLRGPATAVVEHSSAVLFEFAQRPSPRRKRPLWPSDKASIMPGAVCLEASIPNDFAAVFRSPSQRAGASRPTLGVIASHGPMFTSFPKNAKRRRPRARRRRGCSAPGPGSLAPRSKAHRPGRQPHGRRRT